MKPLGDFFTELKRRKVVRVGVVYAATAFVVLEAADIMLPRLGVPEWAMSFVVVLTVLGFPIALVLAWALEVTPDGIKRTEGVAGEVQADAPAFLGTRTVAVAAGLLLLGVGLGAGWFLRPAPTPPVPSAGDGGGVEGASIAVLPFANVSADPENAYFADGLTEEVLNSLAQVTSLKVAGRTSSFYFKDRNEELHTIGTQLGVDHVLEGSVRRSGDRLRITVQLIKVDDGFRLWSDSYDREMDDIFAIQDEIARAIVEALRVELDTALPGQRRPTESLPAYERLLEARTLIARRGSAGLTRAIVLLDEAVRLDPAFAEAWGALAQAHSLMYWYDPGAPGEASLARAETAARRALELDPDLASAHQVVGDVMRDRYRWDESEASYRRALELNPNDVEANSQYAQMLGRLGLGQRALPYATRAVQLDPLSPVAPAVLGVLLYRTGDSERGLRHVQDAGRLGPDLLWIPMVELTMLLDRGELEAALDLQRTMSTWLQANRPDSPHTALYERLRTQGEDAAAILALLREGLTSGPQEVGGIGWAWAVHYGDPELALELMRAERRLWDGAHDPLFGWLPHYAPVRRLAGYRELALELNMPGYWRAHGWPDDCRPMDGDDFECGLVEGP